MRRVTYISVHLQIEFFLVFGMGYITAPAYAILAAGHTASTLSQEGEPDLFALPNTTPSVSPCSGSHFSLPTLGADLN